MLHDTLTVGVMLADLLVIAVGVSCNQVGQVCLAIRSVRLVTAVGASCNQVGPVGDAVGVVKWDDRWWEMAVGRIIDRRSAGSISASQHTVSLP